MCDEMDNMKTHEHEFVVLLLLRVVVVLRRSYNV